MSIAEYCAIIYEYNRANHTGPAVLEGDDARNALRALFGGGKK